MFTQLKKNLFKVKLISRLPFTETARNEALFKDIYWPDDAAFAVALTFDVDYVEDEKALSAVVGILGDHNAPASFACIGLMVEQHAGCYKLLPELGHEIINHSLNHPYHRIIQPDERWATLPLENLKHEITESHKLLHIKLGYTCRGFRTPHFEYRPEIMPVIKELGYTYDSSGFYSERENSRSLPFLIDDVLEIPIYRTVSSYRCIREQRLTDLQWWAKLEEVLEYESSIGGLAVFYFDPQDFPERPWVLNKLISTARENGAWFATMDNLTRHFACL